MHPKIVTARDNALRRMRQIERAEPKLIKFEKMLNDLDYEWSVYVDSFGDIQFSITFSKRSDLDPLLIALAEYADKDEIEPSMYDGSLRAYVNGSKFDFYPEEGSECQLVQVDEEYVEGYTRPIYKMKCEHEHEQAEKAILEEA